MHDENQLLLPCGVVFFVFNIFLDFVPLWISNITNTLTNLSGKNYIHQQTNKSTWRGQQMPLKVYKPIWRTNKPQTYLWEMYDTASTTLDVIWLMGFYLDFPTKTGDFYKIVQGSWNFAKIRWGRGLLRRRQLNEIDSFFDDNYY